MQDFENLCSSFAKCRKCRDLIPEIHDLPETKFKFHLKPYLRAFHHFASSSSNHV